MKSYWKETAIAVLFGLAMPGIVLAIATSVAEPETLSLVETVPSEEAAAPTEEMTEIRPPVTVPILDGGRVTEMELNEYLVGVVLAEMPASFEPEALKAQAVVARTYTMRNHQRGGRHSSAAVCTDPSCCQAYIEPSEYLKSGGTQKNVDKIRRILSIVTRLDFRRT